MLDKAYDHEPTLRSRQLRNNATGAERLLWRFLRNRQLSGIRFNRQVPIGPFICDFVARRPGLVIELDGGQHSVTEDYDRKRTTFLTQRGYRVIRFWNNEVLENLEGVLTVIEEELKNMPSPNPSRLAGGGEE
jgi:very-short-patch-repair endonuclease